MMVDTLSPAYFPPDPRVSECGRYLAGGYLASIAREHLWRDVCGFIAYHVYMNIPTFLPFLWFTWMLPTVGDWRERDARWTFAFEGKGIPADEHIKD